MTTQASSTLCDTSTSTKPTNKPKPKRRQKSPADLQAAHFLKDTLAPVRRTLMLAWLIDVISVLLFILQAFCLAWLFGHLLTFGTGQSGTPISLAVLSWALIFLAIPLLLRPVLHVIKEKFILRAGFTMSTDARIRAFDSLGRLGLARSWYGSDGALASHVIDEPDSLIGYARFSVQKWMAVSTPIIIAIAIASKSLTAALVLLLTAPLIPVFMAFIGIATARKSREQMDALAQLGGRFLDWIRGMNTLDRLGATPIAEHDIAQASEDYRARTMSVLKIAFLNSAVLEFFSALSIALVAVYLGFGLMGILPWAKDQLLTSYQTALFILLLVPEFYAPLRRLGAEYHAKGAAESCAKKLAPMLADPIITTGCTDGNKRTHLPTHAPAIQIDALGVTTNGRTRLDGLSLHLDRYDKVAIMGASGSGKSTLLQALLGFTPHTGLIEIDGTALADWDTDALHAMISYLPQSPALLPISIRDNLRLAKQDATEDEIIQALRDVAMDDVVTNLGEGDILKGMDTLLKERGMGLSGGQAQRLAIAQLLLQDSKIWLLDEPTEHLDSQTRAQIHALIQQLSADKTLLWVTHETPCAWLTGVHQLTPNTIT